MPKNQNELKAISWAMDLEDREYGLVIRGEENGFLDSSEIEELEKVLNKRTPKWDCCMMFMGDGGPTHLLVFNKEGRLLGSVDADDLAFNRR